MKKTVLLAFAAALLLGACGSPRSDAHLTTHRDGAYGFSFTYDDRLFAVSEDPVPTASGHVTLAFGSPPEAGFSVDAQSTDDSKSLSSEQALEDALALWASVDESFRTGPVERTRIDGLPAVRAAYQSDSAAGVVTLMRHGGLQYVVGYMASTEAALQGARPELDRVMQSLRIEQ